MAVAITPMKRARFRRMPPHLLLSAACPVTTFGALIMRLCNCVGFPSSRRAPQLGLIGGRVQGARPPRPRTLAAKIFKLCSTPCPAARRDGRQTAQRPPLQRGRAGCRSSPPALARRSPPPSHRPPRQRQHSRTRCTGGTAYCFQYHGKALHTALCNTYHASKESRTARQMRDSQSLLTRSKHRCPMRGHLQAMLRRVPCKRFPTQEAAVLLLSLHLHSYRRHLEQNG